LLEPKGAFWPMILFVSPLPGLFGLLLRETQR